MLIAVLSLLFGLVLLTGGADVLVRSASSIALKVGVSPLVIGLTVVAFGTSMPEMVVSVQGALSGQHDIAIGNVVGSNICNIALILGLAALIKPLQVHAQILRFDAPLVLVSSIVLVVFLSNSVVSRVEGGVLLLGLIAYVTQSIRAAPKELIEVQTEYAETMPKSSGSLTRDLALVAVGLGLLVGGARLLVSAAVTIATAAGVSEAVIGLTIVAIGTSLPELATSVVAAYRGEGDISIGNVVGSNIFNILGIVGVSALVRPLHTKAIAPTDLAVMVVAALALLLIMRSNRRIDRAEGGVLLLSYIAYVVVLLYR